MTKFNELRIRLYKAEIKSLEAKLGKVEELINFDYSKAILDVTEQLLKVDPGAADCLDKLERLNARKAAADKKAEYRNKKYRLLLERRLYLRETIGNFKALINKLV